MKHLFTALIVIIFLSGCKAERHFFALEAPVDLYEFASMKGKPLLRADSGDTVSVTGKKVSFIGGQASVEFKGYQFYATKAQAHFLYSQKISAKNRAVLPAVSYTTAEMIKKERLVQKAEMDMFRATEADTSYWFAQVISQTPVLDEPFAAGEQITTVPYNAIVKIRRHNYNYFKIWMNDKVGYISAFSVNFYSKTDNPFVRTSYTGPTFEAYPRPKTPTGPATFVTPSAYSTPLTNTPTTGATIHTGPRGGRYYYNSKGNKTYVPRRK